MTTPRAVVLALSLLALIAAGCGGDDEGGGGGALTKTELIAQADAICAEADKELESLGSPESTEQLKEFAGKAQDTAREQVDKLKALEPPADLKADWDRAMALLDQQVDLTGQLADNADDQAKLQEIVAQGEKISGESDAIAKRIGLQACGD